MGVHHFYYGMLLILVAFILAMLRKRRKIVTIILFVLGFIITADDGYQHLRNELEPEYRSPIHNLYGVIYRKSSLIRKANRWLDKVFGKTYDE